MSRLVGNLKDRFFHAEAQIVGGVASQDTQCLHARSMVEVEPKMSKSKLRKMRQNYSDDNS